LTLVFILPLLRPITSFLAPMKGALMNKRYSSPAPPEPALEAAWLGRWFTAARRAGLLALLPAEAWHTLSALLSFTRRDGGRSFTLDQLATALGQSRDQTEQRLEQLTRIEWKGDPLARLERDPAGEVVGVQLAPIDCLDRIDPPVEPATTTDPPGESFPTGDRKPLAPALDGVGLDAEPIDSLLQRFPAERIRRQLDWLPHRQARNPAALLIRAIEQNWSAPREAG
jgi:hypothetical protein